ncbi:response regulator transcription factor [Prescottella agglutinans]|uniref:DNA-binding NarL/FixJ family response regulator n=1 Tax=Prescottella agglutinans TaxID=1644129 RepID=A0ABT6M5W9_9NOCA|nr:response regulator transcription factor [Prescottella agglutinans]MDH6279707.1 DNA-binding NarL/FixJ family response regulator [Prescottella agglutinans]
MTTITVLLADDQELVRDGIAAVLNAENDITVIGEASNGREAIHLARTLCPDVIVMDIRMPVLDGIRAAEEILADDANCSKVLMLTTFDLDDYVYDALSVGASGFLLKQAPSAEFTRGVRTVAAGESMLAPTVTTRLIAEFSRRRSRRRNNDSAPALTPRELDVLRALARGLSNREIAAELFLAEETVKTHVGRILSKLGLRDRTQAVVFYYESELAHGDR